MQQQEGPTDCGLFATTVCRSLASKRNLSNTRWGQSKIRDHLAVFITSIKLYSERYTQQRKHPGCEEAS